MILKSFFDFILTLFLLPIFLPIIVVLCIISWLETGQSGIFTQKRVGRNAVLFRIYKIRSMKDSSDEFSTQKNVSSYGKFLRNSKLDETPQLFNILLGQMSFVGPRPDIEGYADQLKGDDRIILTVKPGITGPAQLAFRNEELILKEQKDPLRYNDEILWPQKVQINKEYVENWSFLSDINYLIKTIF